MVERRHKVTDEGSLHKYRAEIPNTVVRGIKSRGLSVYAKWLYVYLKSIAGDNGLCFQSTTTIAGESGISRGQVSEAKKELVKQGLIAVAQGKNPRRDPDHIRIKDIWPANMQEFCVHNTNTLNDSESIDITDETEPSVHNTNTEIDQCSQYEQSVHNTNTSVHNTNPRRSLEEDPLKKETLPPSPPIVPPSPHAGDVAVAVTPRLLMEWYNTETPPSHPKIKSLSPERIKNAKRRAASFPDPLFWHAVFEEVGKSPLLLGNLQSPGHENFRGDFDWILAKGKDGVENCLKVYEGKYRDKELSPPGQRPKLEVYL